MVPFLSARRSAAHPYSSLEQWLLGLTATVEHLPSVVFMLWGSREVWLDCPPLHACVWLTTVSVSSSFVGQPCLLGFQGAANKHWLWKVLWMELMFCLHAPSPPCMQAHCRH